jgi:hypothetical protein
MSVKTTGVALYPVARDPIHLSKAAGDVINWSTAGPVRIEFEKSPFKNRTFYIDSAGVIPSGPINGDALGEYKYSIFWEDGHLDPRVIIHK